MNPCLESNQVLCLRSVRRTPRESHNRATTIQASPLLCIHVPKCVSPFSEPVAVVCLKIFNLKHPPLLKHQLSSASGTGRLHRSSSRCHPATGWISCASSIQQILVYSCLESRYRTDASKRTYDHLVENGWKRDSMANPCPMQDNIAGIYRYSLESLLLHLGERLCSR